MSRWQTIIVLFLIGILGAGIFYYMTQPSYPTIVNIYKWRYSQMSELENKKLLTAFTRTVMKDSIEGLNHSELLEWQHKYMVYPSDPYKVMWETKVRLEGRLEEPIKILGSGFKVYVPEDQGLKAMGKCGEFALVYTGLCLVNDIPVRLVIDCSMKTDNRSTGDHVWNEIYINGSWVHVDPTENKVNQPYLYRDQWNKNVNRVYAITSSNEVVDVTDKYA